jgi:hypothetical protein
MAATMHTSISTTPQGNVDPLTYNLRECSEQG